MKPLLIKTPKQNRTKHTPVSISTTAMFTVTAALTFSLLIVFIPISSSCLSLLDHEHTAGNKLPESDIDLLEFPLNLEFLEADFFLWGALGRGLDDMAPGLAAGGPPPLGARKARLDPFTNDVILQFGLQEVGHLRAIQNTVKGFPRPLLNLSSEAFGEVMNSAFGRPLIPHFDPYANPVNYLLASYVVPYVGLTGYVGANPKLKSPVAKRLVAGLLAVESGQDAVIRALLYQMAGDTVVPYKVTVAEFTNRISNLRNMLGNKQGVKDDEGIVVKKIEGAEGSVSGNILAGDKDSLGYDRTPEEILRIVYGKGDERIPGGFYPCGAKGRIAKRFLEEDITKGADTIDFMNV